MTESDLHLDVDLDAELEPEDLEGGPPVATLGDPVLVVDDLHIVYRVFGGKARQAARSGAHVEQAAAPRRSFVRRLLSSTTQHVGSVSEVHAVRGISFVARHGEAIGIVGVNGSGKSTLLRAVTGLIPPHSGAVYVAGEPALLGVNAALMPELTGERNIMIGGLALGLTPKQVEERFDEVVEFAGIGDFVYMPMKTYSSGMGARLRFAISSSATPDILMIDEALATGDAAFKARSKARIDEVRENAGTIFLVSHSIGTVEAMCTRVLWVHQGQLVMDGSTSEVLPHYKEFVRAHRQARSSGRAGGVGPRGRRKNGRNGKKQNGD
ncbi:ABC transporter ATP-binding protein [Isoptericola sp. BMS4]|uniref:ABC transporter ATP-binding protein n=1 Tax=Isoptericola sp. BMS4 TaxID=2527875 RepID=UPI001423088B|nr:ABC transporter ATP-binding protein [Isoptericola sp. BMS4]